MASQQQLGCILDGEHLVDIETPRIGECIQVGDVIVTVLAVVGNEVRLGLSAAQHDDRYPEELLERLAQQRGRSCQYEH